MDTNPPPFGDPLKVDRENASSVRKGMVFGCGGCALLAAVGLAAVAGVAAFVLMLMRSDETCQMTLQAAQNSEVLKRELGEPMRMGWLVTGDISKTNNHGSVNLTVPIIGPEGEAKVHTMGMREDGGPWHFSRMEATVSKTGQTVDLR